MAVIAGRDRTLGLNRSDNLVKRSDAASELLRAPLTQCLSSKLRAAATPQPLDW